MIQIHPDIQNGANPYAALCKMISHMADDIDEIILFGKLINMPGAFLQRSAGKTDSEIVLQLSRH